MVQRSSPRPGPARPANLPSHAIPDAIRSLKRRRREFEEAHPETHQGNLLNYADSLCMKLDGTLAEIFGQDTLEYERTHVSQVNFAIRFNFGETTPHAEYVAAFSEGQARAISRISALIDLLSERLDDSGQPRLAGVLKAYEGLSLHPEIDRAAGDLYRNGHYPNAIEDAVKALNGIVRLRSGIDLDGMTLMERAFSPGNPVLKFNELVDQSDRDEQKGFMMLFSGAVSGLRNPRAHKFIQDDPERALEFIAFVSLLAKLLDKAKKVSQGEV
jgi:uncharacterized protein (TIGR02391 family)